MISEKQLAANRQNALKATGPRTPEGKARSSQNSTIHGLFSEHVVAKGESKKKFKAFRDEFLAELDPVGLLEGFLAQSIVCSAWRLARIVRIEREMMDSYITDCHQRAVKRGEDLDFPPFGRAFRWDSAYAKGFDKLRRYEGSLRRVVSRDLHELQRLQASRKGQPTIPPLAVDVDISGSEPGNN